MPLDTGASRTTRQNITEDSTRCTALVFDRSGITRPSERSRIEPGRVSPTLKTDGQICVIPVIRSHAPLMVSVPPEALIPRRLLPVECERLMGWPDEWPNVSDRHGRATSDTFRYHACGNGIVSHLTQWIGGHLRKAHYSHRPCDQTP
jgi:site-specific DNA-cytosine methylase